MSVDDCVILQQSSLLARLLTVSACLLVAVQPAVADDGIPAPYNSEKSELKLSTPQEAVDSMQLPDGFRANVWAAEPMIQQPIAMTFDDRGRMWVAENNTYAESGLNFDLNQRDRIVILEDTDGDGAADKRTVFWDQAVQLTSVEVGFGGVWALCAPNLLFIPDRDGDDVPDSDPIVLLDGWDGDTVRHNIVNGLKWGPDGWLYGRHGIMATSYVGRPGAGEDARTPINCGIWRYHPQTEKFEVVARGGTNSWGMDWNEDGQLFFINTVIGHLWHVVPGASYRRMYGEHFNPHLYELMEQTADHFHWDTSEAWSDVKKIGVSKTTDEAGGGHAHCGMMIYLGDNWPDEYRGDVFTMNLHGLRMNRDHLARTPTGYVGTHAPDVMRVGDPWFRGIELTYDASGAVFIADWTDVGECHENDGVHRLSGRIYRIADGSQSSLRSREDLGEALRGLAGGLRAATSQQLVAAHRLKNEWFTRQARRILHERFVEGQDLSQAAQELVKLAGREHARHIRLRALWTLHVLQSADRGWWMKQLADDDEHVRTTALRVLTDNQSFSSSEAQSVVEWLEDESSGLVLTYAASSLNHLPEDLRWKAAGRIAAHEAFQNDVNLQLLLWYQLEPNVLTDPTAAVSFLESTRMRKVRTHVVRRLAADSRHNVDILEQLTAVLGSSADEELTQDILTGMTEAFRGWLKIKAPGNWVSVARKLRQSTDPQIARASRELGVLFGDGRALDDLRRIVKDGKSTLAERRNAIRVLVDNRDESAPALLQSLLGQRDLAGDAVRGLAAFDDPKTAELILKNFRRFYSHGRYEAANTLASRPSYATALLVAIESGSVDQQYITPFQIRQMKTFKNASIDDALARIWPDEEARDKSMQEQIEKLKAGLDADTLAAANRSAGRVLFEKSCSSCHTLFGSGGKVGPDLTGAQRKNLHYLLENILAPSAQVAENYRVSIVILDDGRVINGVIRKQNDETTEIQTPREVLVVASPTIDEIHPTGLSMMPERLLDALTAEQKRDLIGYLMSGSQIARPAK